MSATKCVCTWNGFLERTNANPDCTASHRFPAESERRKPVLGELAEIVGYVVHISEPKGTHVIIESQNTGTRYIVMREDRSPFSGIDGFIPIFSEREMSA